MNTVIRVQLGVSIDICIWIWIQAFDNFVFERVDSCYEL